ncbi:MAG: sulfotransferase domain-containing protein [Okeania sp. SIO3B5]|uniref:sulfotransferase domain-containing protein n=1 Tax=Okeania sp. SIO3B5 TaxID=2607811 RepID=UPI0014016FD4|nr:sulfotransferase domain-containing protein [Okeania sp. SIO3B5]NEO53875.1 sulfotransferase domain-containing protein [Okeania sp. SIO3B5]
MKKVIKDALYFSQHLSDYRFISSPFRKLPDFIIIGVMKSGTTSLYNYLIQHPQIMAAKNKEVHFFDKNFHQGIYWYKSHFPLYSNIKYVTGEGSPYYIFHPLVAQRIAKTIPQVKLIVVLRNPVNRAFSHYQRNAARGFENLSFEEAIDQEEERLKGEREKILNDERYKSRKHIFYSYLSRGRYVEQIQNWLHYFPQKQFLFIKSEDLFINTSEIYSQVLEFLDLPQFKLNTYEVYLTGEYKKSRKDMNSETRIRLLEYFEPYNQKLYDFLGDDYNWS